jgi:hypothetical protein
LLDGGFKLEAPQLIVACGSTTPYILIVLPPQKNQLPAKVCQTATDNLNNGGCLYLCNIRQAKVNGGTP